MLLVFYQCTVSVTFILLLIFYQCTMSIVRALHHAACSGPDTYIVHGAPARQFGTRHHNAGHLNKDDWRHRGMKKGAA